MKVSDLPSYIRNANAITFIIGAGASVSAGIPLAAGLIDAVKKKYGHCLQNLSDEEKNNYGKVMNSLSPSERRDIIEPILLEAKLNWGHVALASIVMKENVKRILSFNFDFLLEKASILLGYHLPVYDFGIAATSNIFGLADKAIFHLHGQSYGLKLLNSDHETEEHANSLRPLIRDSLCNHVTIVSGYSGCADGVSKVILESYNDENRLFWLGYEKEPNQTIAPLFKNTYACYLGECDFDLSMIEIARGLKCWPLPIIENPPRYVVQQLEPLPDFPTEKESETALLHETRRHLQQISEEWETDKSAEEQEAVALMAQFPIEENKDLSKYNEEGKRIRGWRYLSEAEQLSRAADALEGEARQQKLREAEEKYEAAVRIKPDFHQALANWGLTLSREADLLEGGSKAQKYREAEEKYEAAVRIKPDFHQALANWGSTLSNEADLLEGEAKAQKYSEAEEKFEAAVRIKPDFHQALANWGLTLSREADLLEGGSKAQKYRKAEEKYAAAVRIKPDHYGALANWGLTLSKEADLLEGEAKAQKYHEAEEKYAAAVRIKPDFHQALANWGLTLSNEADLLEGEAKAQKYHEAEEKYAAAVRIKPDYYRALANWGLTLSNEADLLEGEAKAQKYREAEEKFEAAVQIKPDFHEALSNWGSLRFKEADLLEGEAKAQKYREAEEKFKHAKLLRDKSNYNLACLYALTGRTEAALAELEGCCREGSLPDRKTTDEDSDLNSLRASPRFGALYDS